jgi:hypothetical protein
MWRISREKDEHKRNALRREWAFEMGRREELAGAANAVQVIICNTESQLAEEKARLRSYIAKEITRAKKGWSNPSAN